MTRVLAASDRRGHPYMHAPDRRGRVRRSPDLTIAVQWDYLHRIAAAQAVDFEAINTVDTGSFGHEDK